MLGDRCYHLPTAVRIGQVTQQKHSRYTSQQEVEAFLVLRKTVRAGVRDGGAQGLRALFLFLFLLEEGFLEVEVVSGAIG